MFCCIYQNLYTEALWCLMSFQAAQNLVVLSREDAGAEQIFRNEGVKLLEKLLQSKQEDVVLSALRTLVGLCTGHQSRVSVTSIELFTLSIFSSSLGFTQHTCRISSECVHSGLSYFGNKHANLRWQEHYLLRQGGCSG